MPDHKQLHDRLLYRATVRSERQIATRKTVDVHTNPSGQIAPGNLDHPMPITEAYGIWAHCLYCNRQSRSESATPVWCAISLDEMVDHHSISTLRYARKELLRLFDWHQRGDSDDRSDASVLQLPSRLEPTMDGAGVRWQAGELFDVSLDGDVHAEIA